MDQHQQMTLHPKSSQTVETWHWTSSNLGYNNNNNNNNLLHLYSAFLGTLSALHRRGESPQPPLMCSIHLEDATAAILHQNPHHTPAYWWRGDKEMKPIGVCGLLGGHDGQRSMRKFGQDAGVTPLLFSKDILGFLMTTVSQDIGLTSHPKELWASPPFL